MGRNPSCSKEGVKRGPWTAQEDQILADYIKFHGEGKWRNVPKQTGLKRCGKSCRLRWLNYLRPSIKRGSITQDEEDLIIRLHKLLGNRWALIAGRIPGRTDNEIKNYWKTNLCKKPQGEVDYYINPSANLSSCRPSIIDGASDPNVQEVLAVKSQQSNAEDKQDNYDPNYTFPLGSSMLENLVSIINAEESDHTSCDGSFSSTSSRSREEEDSWEQNILMEHFYMREMSLSEFLDADFTKLSNHLIAHGTTADDSSQGSMNTNYQLAAFTDLAEDWIL